MEEPGRFKQGHRDRTGSQRVTDEGVLWIRARREEGMTHSEIREAFRAETDVLLGMTTISDIAAGRSHANVSE
jgi:hypothetical protein